MNKSLDYPVHLQSDISLWSGDVDVVPAFKQPRSSLLQIRDTRQASSLGIVGGALLVLSMSEVRLSRGRSPWENFHALQVS